MAKWIAIVLLLAIGAIIGIAAMTNRNMPRKSDAARERIVSLAPSLTGILQALGQGRRLVGVSAYCEGVPPDMPRVGTLLQPNLEGIVELRPELVLGIRSAAQRGAFRSLESRGIPVLRFGGDKIADVREAVERLGQEFAAEERARAILEGLDRALSAAMVESSGPRVLFVVNRGPIFAAGAGSFVHEMIRAAGGRNALDAVEADWPRVDLERILANPPDLIIDNTLGADHDPEILEEWRAFAPRLSAVAAGQVDSFSAVQAGVQIPEWVERLRSLVGRSSPLEVIPRGSR